MTKIQPRIVLITLVIAGLATSCSEDNGVDPGSLPISEYENLTQKDHVLLNLSRAYNAMNIDEYRRLLAPAPDFTFFFSQADFDSGFVSSPFWNKAAEDTATSNMFSRVPSKDHGFVINRIDLRLDYAPGEDVWIREAGSPGNHDGEDWFERTVTYNMTIIAGDESFISTDIRASLVIKQVDVGGVMVWQIVKWHDGYSMKNKKEGQPGVSPASKSGAGAHATTWGRMKSMFGPEYEGLTQKDHVLLNLEKAYTKMNINEYKRLLVNEFTFFFSQADIDNGIVSSWGFAAEAGAASNMFNRVPSKDQGFIIDRIDLRLDYTPGDDVWIREVGTPGYHEGEDWFERTVTYNLVIAAGSESFISTDIRASFVIKQVDVNGAMIWKIVAWKDDIGLFLSVHTPGGSPESKSGAGTHGSTWGAMKFVFR